MKTVKLMMALSAVLILACPLFAESRFEEDIRTLLCDMAKAKDPEPSIQRFYDVRKHMSVDVNVACDDEGNTPLRIATALANVKAVGVFCDNGAIIDELSVFMAVRRDSIDIMKIFIDHGASVFFTVDNGRSPASLRAISPEMRELLEEASEAEMARERELEQQRKEFSTSLKGAMNQ